MLRNRLIPSLLIARRRLVKGVRFADHRDAGSPGTTARAHSAQGADELVALDIEADREGRGPDFAALADIVAEAQVPLTVGGGIRDEAAAAACFAAGADKICLTMAAMDQPNLVDRLARIYGAQAIVVGLDLFEDQDGRWLYDYRRRECRRDRQWLSWLKEAVARGAGEIRLVSVNREGTRTGYDIAGFLEARDRVSVPIIVEGGAGSLDHLADAMKAGADSLALGTMLVFSDNNIVKLKRFLAGAGFPVRT